MKTVELKTIEIKVAECPVCGKVNFMFPKRQGYSSCIHWMSTYEGVSKFREPKDVLAAAIRDDRSIVIRWTKDNPPHISLDGEYIGKLTTEEIVAATAEGRST